MIKTPKDVTRPSERNGSGAYLVNQNPLTPNEGSGAMRQSHHL